MNYPPDAVMHQFHAMSQAAGLDHEEGPLQAYVPDRTRPDGCRRVVIDGETIDELVRRGWCVLLGQDEIEATDQGIYWLRKYLNDREKAERRRARRPR